MALTFTDAQLRSVSGEALAIPALIVALNAQKVTVIQGKADTLAKDNGNHAFFEFFRSTVEQYHAELKHKNGTSKANYLFQSLDDGAAQRAGNLHYPTSPIWTQLPPKADASNNGNPTAAFTPHEVAALPPITSQIALLKTGFADGATTALTVAAYVPGVDLEVDSAAWTVGQRVVVDIANKSLLATILAIKPPSTTGVKDLELSILAPPAGALGIGSRIRNFHPGFSNAEREGTATPYAPEVLAYFQAPLVGFISTWETTLDGQLTALNLLDAGGAENTSRDAEKNSINTAKTAIDTWQAAPNTGLGVGKYGDTALTPIESNITARNAAIPTRVTQITTAIGSVAQNPDGTFTGTGHYFSIFKWVDLRASKAGGTLFLFYNFDTILKFIDQKIVSATAAKAEYDAKLLVKKMTEDADGTTFIKVENTTGLSPGNSVKLVDDETATFILTANILSIAGLLVELSSSAAGFLVEKRARLVKFL